jgi:creatinine amidohydrolase
MVTAMANNVPSRLIGELTFQEIPKLLGATSILCLPIGSIEQHGPHLPLNTDAVLAEEFTRRIIGRWVETYDLWQLPTLTVSLAREHEWAAGTLSLSIQGMTTLVRDLGREIARSLPARNLAIINGHGGNRGILEALAQDLRADFGLNVCILHPAVWADAGNAAAIPEIHGGKNETSMMLAIAPQLVRRDLIAQKINLDAGAVRTVILDPAVTWPWTTNESEIADNGTIGDPKAATAELGQRLLEQLANNAGNVFKQLLDRQHRDRD